MPSGRESVLWDVWQWSHAIGYSAFAGEPVVLSLLSAYENLFGRKTEARAFVAGSDAPHMGCPTVICGPGSIAQAHSTNEFVSKAELIQATQMYLWAVLDLLSR